jgi:hypothetical protein
MEYKIVDLGIYLALCRKAKDSTRGCACNRGDEKRKEKKE